MVEKTAGKSRLRWEEDGVAKEGFKLFPIRYRKWMTKCDRCREKIEKTKLNLSCKDVKDFFCLKDKKLCCNHLTL